MDFRSLDPRQAAPRQAMLDALMGPGRNQLVKAPVAGNPTAPENWGSRSRDTKQHVTKNVRYKHFALFHGRFVFLLKLGCWQVFHLSVAISVWLREQARYRRSLKDGETRDICNSDLVNKDGIKNALRDSPFTFPEKE